MSDDNTVRKKDTQHTEHHNQKHTTNEDSVTEKEHLQGGAIKMTVLIFFFSLGHAISKNVDPESVITALRYITLSGILISFLLFVRIVYQYRRFEQQ